MARFVRSSPTPTTDQPTSTPIHHQPRFASLGKRPRLPTNEPTPMLKKRKLSLHNPSLGGSSRVHRRDTPKPNGPQTTQLRPLKFRPRSILFDAILSDGEGSLVLVITLKAAPHVLKLYPPPTNNHRDCFVAEYDAYTVLEKTHYNGSVAPRCYGSFDPIDMDGVLDAFQNLTVKEAADLRSTHFARACRAGTPGTALLIQYIPAVSALNCTVTSDIIKKAEDGLEDLHRRGVVHGDPAPRNLLITEDDIFWIDYDLATTTRSWEIEDGRFFADFIRMRREFGLD